MCLHTITDTITLKRDRRVWKIVRVYDRGKSFFSERSYFQLSPLYRRILTTIRTKFYVRNGDSYESGFHCYPSRRIAEREFPKYYQYEACTNAVLDYIIPKGTTITRGIEYKLSLIHI